MKSLGFQEIPKKSKKQQRQKKANNAAEVPLPSRQQPPRIRAMVDLSYGVNEWDNSTGRKRQKTAARCIEPPPQFESTRTDRDRRALRGEQVIKYFTQTKRNHLGTVTQVLQPRRNKNQEWLFRVTYRQKRARRDNFLVMNSGTAIQTTVQVSLVMGMHVL